MENLVRDRFMAGVSSGRVGESLESLMGSPVSASAASATTEALGERVRQCHQRRPPYEAVYLFADAVCMTAKGMAKPVRTAPLTGHVFKTDGVEEPLAFRVADS